MLGKCFTRSVRAMVWGRPVILAFLGGFPPDVERVVFTCNFSCIWIAGFVAELASGLCQEMEGCTVRRVLWKVF